MRRGDVDRAAATPGDVTIAPATLDAIDARSGKPSRFATGNLSIKVEAARRLVAFLVAFGRGNGVLAADAFGRDRRAGRRGAGSDRLGVRASARRCGRRSRAPPVPPSPAQPAGPDDFGLLIARLAAEPTRANVAGRARGSAPAHRCAARGNVRRSDGARRGRRRRGSSAR